MEYGGYDAASAGSRAEVYAQALVFELI